MISLSIVRGLAVASVLGAVSAVGACGGGSTSASTGPDGDAGGVTTDAATVDATGDDAATTGGDDGGAADAGADIQQNPNVYPAMHHPLPQIEKGSGPIIDHMKIINVTFGTDANLATYDAFAAAIGGTTWWQKSLTPYGIMPATYLMSVALPDTLSGMTMTQAQFESWLAQQVESGALPPPDAETLYAIYPPQGLTVNVPSGGSTAASCMELEGYHGAFGAAVPATTDGGTRTAVTAAYAMNFNCGYGGIRGIEVTASHEIAEAATDPHPDNGLTYYMHSDDAWSQLYAGSSPGGGGEVGDLCAGPSWTESSYYFNKIYSNSAAALSNNPCQPDTSVYYGAAIDTTKEPVNGTLTDGYVTVTPGTTTGVVINVFSAAALPNDLTLNVSAIDATYGQSISFPTGVTATLSQTKANNGDGVILTVTVDPTASASQTLFIVRAELNSSDYNDWPAILKVK